MNPVVGQIYVYSPSSKYFDHCGSLNYNNRCSDIPLETGNVVFVYKISIEKETKRPDREILYTYFFYRDKQKEKERIAVSFLLGEQIMMWNIAQSSWKEYFIIR